MNVVQCLSHSIEAHDMLRLYARIGVDAFDVGGYIDPAHPHDPKRPPVDIAPQPDLKAAVDSLGAADNLTAAQQWLPDALLDWADVIVYHHRLERLFGQWGRIRRWLREGSHRRVIWRSVGQSVTHNELEAAPFMHDGLERVLYSPKERNIPGFSGGASPVIRFGKDPAEWHGWTGEREVVLNIAQHDAEPHARDEWLNWGFWEQATRGLPTVFAGPNTEKIGGLGALSYEAMQTLLRECRAYLYTGTQPASYTLGLIEAMMTGIPVVSIGREWMRLFPYGPALFEGLDLVNFNDPSVELPNGIRIGYSHTAYHGDYNEPGMVHSYLSQMLDARTGYAERESSRMRERAIELFGIDTIADQWAAYLGLKVAA